MTIDVRAVPLADWWPVGPVLLVLLGLAALWGRRAHGRVVERGLAVASVVLLLILQVASIVNAHFEFLPHARGGAR